MKYVAYFAVVGVVAVSSRAQAFETRYDRPVAAAVNRMVNGSAYTHVWACGQNQQMYHAAARAGSQAWAPWERVSQTTLYPCYSAPSAAALDGSPREVMVVYWRGRDNALIEARTSEENVVTITDISSITGVYLVDAPVVADTSGQTVAVAVHAEDAGLYTIEDRGGAWAARPMLLSADQPALAQVGPTMTMVASYNSWFFGQETISAYLGCSIHSFGVHTIFARTRWSQSYKAIASFTIPCGLRDLTDSLFGPITLVSGAGCREPFSGAPTLATRDLANRLMCSIPSTYKPFERGDTARRLTGAVYSMTTTGNASFVHMASFARGEAGRLVYFNETATDSAVITMATELTSAPSMVSRSTAHHHTAFYSRNDPLGHRLYNYDRMTNVETNMGIVVDVVD